MNAISTDKIPNKFNEQKIAIPITNQELLIKELLLTYFCAFYENLPNGNPAAKRAKDSLQRQINDKKGERSKKQEMKFWSLLLQEFINHQSKDDFKKWLSLIISLANIQGSNAVQDNMSTADTNIVSAEVKDFISNNQNLIGNLESNLTYCYDEFIIELNLNKCKLDPRYKSYFEKSVENALDLVLKNSNFNKSN